MQSEADRLPTIDVRLEEAYKKPYNEIIDSTMEEDLVMARGSDGF